MAQRKFEFFVFLNFLRFKYKIFSHAKVEKFTDTCDTYGFWDDHVVNHPKIRFSQVEGVYGIIYEVREVCSIFTILE